MKCSVEVSQVGNNNTVNSIVMGKKSNNHSRNIHLLFDVKGNDESPRVQQGLSTEKTRAPETRHHRLVDENSINEEEKNL